MIQNSLEGFVKVSQFSHILFNIFWMNLIFIFGCSSLEDDWIPRERIKLAQINNVSSNCQFEVFSQNTQVFHRTKVSSFPAYAPTVPMLHIPLTAVHSEEVAEDDQDSAIFNVSLENSLNKSNKSRKKVTQMENAQSVSCVDLNTSSLEQIEGLRGIGPEKAKRIVERRTRKPFKRWREVTRVKGIGVKSFQKFQHQLCPES